MKKELIAQKPEIWGLSKDNLEKYLREYDELHGWYPEHPYEGFAVWRFLLEKIEGREFDLMAKSFDDLSDKPPAS